MNVTEFSDNFDVKLTAHRFPKRYGMIDNELGFKLDEYEKSVYLTRAQNDLVIELYSGRNSLGVAYEQTEELRRYLADLNVTKKITAFNRDRNRKFNFADCTIDDSLLFITKEECSVIRNHPCYSREEISCTPIRRDEFNSVKDNPFKNNKVWRLDTGKNTVRLISKHKILEYRVDYIKRQTPIILEDISPLTIEGESDITECQLHPALHDTILDRAVLYAVTDIVNKFPKQEE